MVNLELYRIFYTVAKCGSLTKAAQELYISQPAVSQAIKQLESQLQTSLFNRTHNGMELSEGGGKLIFRQVEEGLKLFDDAENKLHELKNTATGTIRISATDAIYHYFLADRLAEYHAAFPAVKLELVSALSPSAVGLLKDGKCDVAFVNLPVCDSDIKLYGTVKHLNDIFVAGERFAGLKEKTLQLKDLQEYPLVMIEENTVFRKSLATYLQTVGVRLKPDTEACSFDLLKKLVVKGMGIGCVPREYCLAELESGELFELKTEPALPARGVGIVLANHLKLTYAMKQFVSSFNREEE